MPPLRNRDDLYRLANRLTLTITHFAKGSYPVRSGRPEALAVNRMLTILANPGGAANFIRDGRGKHIPAAGTVYFIPAGHPAEVRLDETLRFVSIQFNVELYPGVELFTALGRMRVKKDPELARRLDAAFESPNRLWLAMTLKERVATCAREALADGDAPTLERASRFSAYGAVLEYMSAHCTAETRTADLARTMHLSREAFSRRFAADTGITPKRFIDRQLMRRADELLRRPDATAREVAATLRFSSEYAFSRFFRAHAGVPPGAYRKRLFP